MGDSEPISIPLDDYQDTVFHRWFAMRSVSAARAAVAFTTSPAWLSDPVKRDLVANGNDAAIASAILHDRSNSKPDNIATLDPDKEHRLLDLCAGTGTVAAVAARFGFDALSVELSIVPHLIDRVLHDYAVSMREGANSGARARDEGVSVWRGFAAEVEDFANRVWRGARERLGELFEEGIDIRLWVRIIACPSCGRQVPVLSNLRLSSDTALNIPSDPGLSDETEFPRFGLLRTDFPDSKGTYARGICTCPFCHAPFGFRGYDLIPLRWVPIAVRLRNSNALTEIDSPGAYVRQVKDASDLSLAASSRSLGNRTILAEQQSIFHDARGEPVSVDSALLPRQRAYFAALAASMGTESKSLEARPTLTEDHRLAVRSAVALLISGQIAYVNTFVHRRVDKPNPATRAGRLRFGSLFTELGGHELERSWQKHLGDLLDLLQESSSSARAVRAIQADAAAIPLPDSSVSAVVWDLPYYDKVDYNAVGEPYQAILAAMVPDLVKELTVPPNLHSRERAGDLLRQAREARRVVSTNGSIGVFWLAREPAELQDFLAWIAPAGLQPLRMVRLDRIQSSRAAAGNGSKTYLLVLQPIAAEASAVVVDAETVLALARVGALSLYDGLAELLESALDPAELERMLAGEFYGSSRQRLAGYLASHQQLEQLLVDYLGRMTLASELVRRGADGDELRSMEPLGLAQQLLAELGFAVPRPVRFSILGALRECEGALSRLVLANSREAVRGSFFTCFSQIEQILRYASLAWSLLARDDQWNDAFAQIINSATSARPYWGPNKLTFGQYISLFTRLPVTFSGSNYAFEKELFGKISRAIRRARIDQKLSDLVKLRNSVEHNSPDTAALSPQELRQKCRAALAEVCAALEDLSGQHLLPLTVRPVEERRDPYGRRVLLLLDPNDAAIEVAIQSETDLTQPLIYFAADLSRRDADPRFVSAARVEELLGLS